jgi:hypothetical protein
MAIRHPQAVPKTFVFRFAAPIPHLGRRAATFLSRKLVREIKTPETRRVDGFRFSGLDDPSGAEFKGSSPTNPVVVVRPAEEGHSNPRAKILKIFLLLESSRLAQVHDS